MGITHGRPLIKKSKMVGGNTQDTELLNGDVCD